MSNKWQENVIAKVVYAHSTFQPDYYVWDIIDMCSNHFGYTKSAVRKQITKYNCNANTITRQKLIKNYIKLLRQAKLKEIHQVFNYNYVLETDTPPETEDMYIVEIYISSGVMIKSMCVPKSKLKETLLTNSHNNIVKLYTKIEIKSEIKKHVEILLSNGEIL